MGGYSSKVSDGCWVTKMKWSLTLVLIILITELFVDGVYIVQQRYRQRSN